jgi:hypothetical protein
MFKLFKRSNVVIALSCFVFALLVSQSRSSFAVGPELPQSPKYSTFEIRGRVVSSFNENYSLQGACPLDYAQTVMKLYINDDVGTVAVIVPEKFDIPNSPTCVLITGMLLPPCYGDDVSIAVVGNIVDDGTCD